MKTLNLTLILAASVGVATAADPVKNDWPRFRGPTGDGVSLAKGIPTTWSATQNVLWSADLPKAYVSSPRDVISADKQNFAEVERLDKTEETLAPLVVSNDDTSVLNRSFQPWSSPIVSGDKVFVATAGIRPEGNKLLCFNLADGKPLWETPIPPGPWRETRIYPRGPEYWNHATGYNLATPCTDGERVYVLFGSGDLTAVDINGKVVWQQLLSKASVEPTGKYGNLPFTVASSPLLNRDLVLVMVGGSLKAYDRLTGVSKYDVQINRAEICSTPILVTFKEKTVLITSLGFGWQGIDPENGQNLWKWNFRTRNGINGHSSPVYGAGLLHADGGRGGAVPVDESSTGDISKSEKWTASYVAGLGGYSSPVIVDGVIYKYVAGIGGVKKQRNRPLICKLLCIELNTGKTTSTLDMPGLTNWTSPLATADGYVYYATGSKSYVVKTGAKPEVIGPNDLGDYNFGSCPAVVDGKLIIRGGNKLWCIGKP